MRKIKHKIMIIACVIIVCLGVLEFTGTLPYIVARISSSIYMDSNYPKEGFEFEREEYIHILGEYWVIYKDKDGSTQGLGFKMYPKEFPIFVIHDSIKGEG